MNKLTYLLGAVVLGTVVFTAKAEAQTRQQPEALLIAQAKPQDKEQPGKIPTNLTSNDEKNIEALINQASEDLEKGNLTAAIAKCNAILKIDKQNFPAYVLRGLANTGLKQYQVAVTDFEQAIQINPNSHYSYFGRGFARYHLKLYQESLADFDQTIKIEPEYAHAYYWRGISKGFLGNKQGAISDLGTAAELYKKQGKPEDAKDALDLIKQIG
jgi:tetratricopeptide (TPR) repeat protein